MSGYFRPSNLSEGLSLVNETNTIVAGATDVYPQHTSELAWGRVPAQTWLDISALAELRGIQQSTDSTGVRRWRIGALVTWSDIIHAELPAFFYGLVAAAREIGGVQIQNRATLVGNLCNASPAADGVPPLLCLDAQVEIRSSRESRVLPLAEFILGNRQTALRANEMVTAIVIADFPAKTEGYFCKFGARKFLVISIVMVSVLISVDAHGCVADVRIAVGACSAVAQRLPNLEQALIGCAIDRQLGNKVHLGDFESLTPIDDVRADAEYRRVAAYEVFAQMLRDIQHQHGVRL